MLRKTFDGGWLDANGVDLLRSPSLATSTYVVLFRSLLNPVDYDGRLVQEAKDSYRTNELGFLIVLAFFGALGQSFASYRRFALLD